MGIYNKFKTIFLTFGVIIWIGALSPEIIVKNGDGCIFNEDGEALTAKEAQDFMESYFYDRNNKMENIEFKLGFLEIFSKN